MQNRIYIAIDLKSFYASVECQERCLDPLNTNLVVADESRTDKTICLAVSPSLKAYGIPGRARLFEVKQSVKKINYDRKMHAKGHVFKDSSYFDSELKQDSSLSLDFIIATPRMALYLEYSTRIYDIYLKYIAPEDIIVYSIDEVFMDVTGYLHTYNLSAHDLAMKIILDIYKTTGITATAGIGTNLYLAKVAMDIVAKHMKADENGVRIATLNEMNYRKLLWNHEPLTDFWRVGRGYFKKLTQNGLYTMGDIARCSLTNEDLLYKLFGINAELLIDHAWGYEPCTIQDIKAYKPKANSLSIGQVLQSPYTYEKAKIIIHEMVDLLSLDLVDKDLVTNRVVLSIGYDIENLKDPTISNAYHGEIVIDGYGRKVPKHSHGTENLDTFTASSKEIMHAFDILFDRIVNKSLFIRRIYVVAANTIHTKDIPEDNGFEQLDLFTDYTHIKEEKEKRRKEEKREYEFQKAALYIHKKYGKNALLKGMNLEEGATTRDRNKQIGGHKA